MITTVTTSTVTTVTTIAAMGLTGVVTIAAVVCLIVFLTIRELAGAGGPNASLRRVARFFGIGVLPLVIAFGIIVAVKISELIA